MDNKGIPMTQAQVSARLEGATNFWTDLRDKAERALALQKLAQPYLADPNKQVPASIHKPLSALEQELYATGVPASGKALEGFMAGINLALGTIKDLREDLRESFNFETIANLMETRRPLPEGFDDWSMASEAETHLYYVGDTLAHVAARHGYLPDDFKGWAWMSTGSGMTVAHVAAMYGHLPKDFYNWELAGHNGETVAHVAAEFSSLPANFNRLSLCDKTGMTVAHILAIQEDLPDGFDDWGMCDKRGWSVAHEAAKHGTLPEGFDRWEITDLNGSTVAHTAAEFGLLPEGFNQWGLTNSEGISVAQVYVEHGQDLPENFDQWGLISAEYRPGYQEDSYETPKMGM
jgi:hypothetical protein